MANANFRVAVPTRFRLPKFGMGSFYRQTHAAVGNYFRNIYGMGQFYRQSQVYLPSGVRSDLTNCPAATAGQPCPIAPPQIPGAARTSKVCPAKASGQPCPLHSKPLGQMPRFGLRGLGQSSGIYVDTSGYSVDGSGNILDNYGNTVYAQSTTPVPGNYGPFTVDSLGNVWLGQQEIWSGELLATAPTVSAPATAAPAKPSTAAPSANPPSGITFYNPPTGYPQQQPPPTPVSWWNKTTKLFGTTFTNVNLVAGSAIVGVVLLMSSARKRR